MPFSNPQLADDELPDIETIAFQSVDSSYPVIVAIIAAAYVLVSF